LININLLPKNLRRVREPGYWRLLAVAFPLLVFAVVFVFQFFAYRTVQNLEQELATKQDQLALLQPFLQEQEQLLQRQRQLNELIVIAQAVRQNRIVWTSEISGLLELLPPATETGRPSIDFSSVSMRALGGQQQSPERFEGQPVVAEVSINGEVVNIGVLADFVQALEDSQNYGVVFQNASRQAETEIYTYSLTTGALATQEEPQ
jgi:type IV pilus assembly protein PilN